MKNTFEVSEKNSQLQKWRCNYLHVLREKIKAAPSALIIIKHKWRRVTYDLTQKQRYNHSYRKEQWLDHRQTASTHHVPTVYWLQAGKKENQNFEKSHVSNL